MVFLGDHPTKYWPPTILCVVCECVFVLLCQVLDITAHLGNWATISHQLLPLTLQVTVNYGNATQTACLSVLGEMQRSISQQ